MRTPRRGQTLVLFGLTILLLTLMVTMTLGFAMRAKERMELQHIADAAAYSNAVMTARTLNGIAILNRAEVAVMVTLAATQSNISFASLYLGSLNAIDSNLALEQIPICAAAPFYSPCAQTCARIGVVRGKISQEYSQVWQQYYDSTTKLDADAGRQSRDIQGAATSVWYRQKEMYDSLLSTQIENQALAKKIVERAAQGHKWESEFVAAGGASEVSSREVKLSGYDSIFSSSEGPYALSPRNRSRELGVDAAMGTRGAEFVRNRDSGFFITTKLQQKLGLQLPTEGVLVSNSGSGHWADDRDFHPPPGSAPYAASADDEASLTGSVGSLACPAIIATGATARLISTDLPDADDLHEWTGGGDTDHQPHTQGDCTNCPGVWTMFIDLNPDNIGIGPQDGKTQKYLWGQPKNVVAVRRNYMARCGDALYAGPCAGTDPWNLMFKFRFTPAGEDFDNRGLRLKGAGDNISNQLALSTGAAYYHRPGHWREPPNFFNPFWRATLVSGAIDSEGNPLGSGSDLQDTASAGGGPSGGTASAVIDALAGAGFKGW